MADSTTLNDSSRCVGHADSLSLHLPRSVDDLRGKMAEQLAVAAPGSDAAILFAEDEDGTRTVELALGDGCPLTIGDKVAAGAWTATAMREFPLRYPGYELGELLIDGLLDHDTETAVERLVGHYTVALVNLKLNTDLERTKNHYFASLQAMQDGIGLFQEREREAISAQFLSQVTSALATQPGALYLLEEPGNPDSSLRLNQALGVPEEMLEELRLPNGEWWPPLTVEQPPLALARDATGAFPTLDDGRLPPVLTSLVTCPLRYHGMTVGVVLAFNADVSGTSFTGKLESVEHLGELGAAIFHRIQLEEVAVRNREVETQLAIAAQIQSRLLPTEAPDSALLECAWSSRAAQKVGGDYLDILTEESGDLHAVIADVSGHGINSALLMTSMRATYRAECFRRPLADLMAKLNTEIANEAGDTGMFVTAAACRIDREAARMSYASAGHNALYVYRSASDDIEELDSTGPSLGFFPGMDYDSAELEMNAGDILLLYTDGIVEATSPKGDEDMFGDDRLKDILRDKAKRPAQEILDTVLEQLREFGKTDCFEDDVSISVIKFAPTDAS